MFKRGHFGVNNPSSGPTLRLNSGVENHTTGGILSLPNETIVEVASYSSSQDLYNLALSVGGCTSLSFRSI